jgi:hypothetical protein
MQNCTQQSAHFNGSLQKPATEKDKLIVAASMFGKFPLVLQSWPLLGQIIFTLLVVFLDNLVKVFPLYFLS